MPCNPLTALFLLLLMLPGAASAAGAAGSAGFAGYANAAPFGHGSVATSSAPASAAAPTGPASMAAPFGHGSVATPSAPASAAAPAGPASMAAPFGHGSVAAPSAPASAAAPSAPASAAAPAAHGSAAALAGKPQPQAIPEQMACGVCGMYPARFPAWQTEIIFKNGKMVSFESSRDMFKYLMNMAAFNKEQTRAEVAAIWVKRHDTGAWTDGELAYYVLGSSLPGPMGAELVSFDNVVAAKDFQAKNGGVVKRFPEITMDMVSRLALGVKK